MKKEGYALLLALERIISTPDDHTTILTEPPVPSDTTDTAAKLDALTTLVTSLATQLQTLTEQVQKINNNPPTPSPPSFAATAVSLPKARAPIPSHAIPQDHHRDLEVTIALDKTPHSHAIRSTPPSELKAQVEQVLKQGGAKVAVHGVRRLATGNIAVRLLNRQDKTSLLAMQPNWLTSLAPGARLTTRTYAVVAHYVSTDFNLEEGAQIIHRSNANLVPRPDLITKVEWLNKRPTKHDTKKRSSLVIYVSDEQTADNLIYHGISVNGELCHSTKFIPFASQCFFCQKFGHISTACPRKNENGKASCARCAGPHLTKSCACPNKTQCTDLRTCTHIPIRCANCNGNHKAFDHLCRVKQAEVERIHSDPQYTYAYFNPDFKSSSCPGEARRD